MARIYRMNGLNPKLILSIRAILSSCQKKQRAARPRRALGRAAQRRWLKKSLIGPRPAPKQTPLCLLDVLTAADQRLI
jgi:hypothetical protein